MAVATPIGKDNIKQTKSVKIDPIKAPFTPAISGDLEALPDNM